MGGKMEYMPLAELLKYGTPAMLLALVILNVYQATVIAQLRKEMSDMKNSITWGDTCNTKHEEINRRLDRLERLENGVV